MSERIEFKADDEIVWDGPNGQIWGRVFADTGGGLYVRAYDKIGVLEPEREDQTVRSVPSSARIVSSVDQLASVAGKVYHAVPLVDCSQKGPPIVPTHTFCRNIEVVVNNDTGSWGIRSYTHIRPPVSDAPGDELVEFETFHEPWGKLVRNVAWMLDHEDRSKPLNARELPAESYAQGDALKLCRECLRQWVLDHCWPEEPQRQTEEELKRFVLAWTDGQVLTDRHVNNPQDLKMVFMCLALAPPPPKDYIEKVGCVYEYMDQAGPRSVNGMPCFFSHRFMHKEDWERVVPVIEREVKRRESISLDP